MLKLRLPADPKRLEWELSNTKAKSVNGIAAISSSHRHSPDSLQFNKYTVQLLLICYRRYRYFQGCNSFRETSILILKCTFSTSESNMMLSAM